MSSSNSKVIDGVEEKKNNERNNGSSSSDNGESSNGQEDFFDIIGLPPALDFVKMEDAILSKWKLEKTFQTSMKLSKERDDSSYTFYDGPPFATGLPHYGHILAGTIKDVVTRYASLQHYQVDRRAGWDCHGLPVEYEIDQKLNITHRNQVLEMGIDKYNETCRSIVTRYTSEWETTITRLGRWIDFDNDYKTMDITFMESVWWVFKQLHEKNLVYQGYKVMPYSTACTTPLSNFEAGLNYKTVKDPAVVVRFPILQHDGDSNSADIELELNLIAWTTTPWTLPSNIALCVHPTMEYIHIIDKKSTRHYILAKSRLPQLYPIMNNKKKWKPAMAAELYEIVDNKAFPGKDLVGKRYKPIFDYFNDGSEESKNYYRVVSDTYVTDDAGTGIVHQAPAFGEDDYRVCLAHGIIQKGQNIPCPVDADGNFTTPVNDDGIYGVHVKKADPLLIQKLKDNERLVQKDTLEHTYPFCWRSDTPLIYKAVPSWFIKVEEIRDNIVNNNTKTYWVPNEVKTGRFHNWLQDARDWAVSRNRFWGTPIPIWTDDNFDEIICIGSLDELEQHTGTRVTDLHRHHIDNLTIPSKKNPGTVLKRVDEVFDCWFESGSMPYAQSHYPFDDTDAKWKDGFPADFIAEGLDQTRGWFYTLMVLSTALFNQPAFKNCIVNGMVLAADGQKMSKRKKNYPDPTVVINKYGADSLRMYLTNSPVVRGESLKFREDGVFAVVKEVFLPLYNAFRFFIQNIQRWEETSISGTTHTSGKRQFIPDIEKVCSSTNYTDIWIQAETQKLIHFVHTEMKLYHLYTVMPALVTFGSQLCNWYVRLNRDRLKGLESNNTTTGSATGDCDDEAEIGLQVLYNVLMDVTIIMAPFTPFLSEFFYQHLRKFQLSYPERLVNDGGSINPVIAGKSNSIHFLKLPTYDSTRYNPNAVIAMETLQSIVELGRTCREKRNVGLKFPIKSVHVLFAQQPETHVLDALMGPLQRYIVSELNVWTFHIISKEHEHDWVTLSLIPNFKVLGKKLGKKMKDVQKMIQSLSHEDAVKCLEEGKLVVDDETTLDAATELESKLEFSKEGDHWEATSKLDGSIVVVVDCTQDEATLSSGMSREFINCVQQLRKAANLDLRDAVEIFFREADGITIVEDAIGRNLNLFEAKFKKNGVPMPARFMPSWSVTLKSDRLDVGGSIVDVYLCRPAIAPSDTLTDQPTLSILSTLEPCDLKQNQVLDYTIDGTKSTITEGIDFYLNVVSKVRSTKALSWLN